MTTSSDETNEVEMVTSPGERETDGLVSFEVHPKRTLRRFVYFAFCFSLVPAAALACLALATAKLGSVGAWQSGTLYLTYTLSSITVATYATKKLGSLNAVLLGAWLYCAYVICFAIALIVPSAQRPLALMGAAMGGAGAGLLWTAQGVYFSQTAELFALESESDWETATSKLSGIFAFILLLEETLLDVASTVLTRVLHVPWSIVFILYASLAVGGTVALQLPFVPRFTSEDYEEGTNLWSKTTATFSVLIRDSKMKYMIGLNAAFGFAGAFLNSFVSGEVLPVALGDTSSSYVGLLVAVHGGVAAVMSLVFGAVSQYTGKGPVLIVGAVSFGLVATPFLLLPDLTQWTWYMLLGIYSVEGVGRATFEGTLKAVFADYFPYEKEGAFANIILQNGLASSLAYVLSFRLTCDRASTYCIEYRDGSLHNLFAFGMIVVVSSAAAVLGYLRAAYLHNTNDGAVQEYRRRSTVSWNERRSTSASVDRRTYRSLEKAARELEDELPALS